MENKEIDKCVLLKRKEYRELCDKADANKPDNVEINIYFSKDFLYTDKINIIYKGNIDVSNNIKAQIYKIINLLNDELKSKAINFINNGKILGENNTIESFKNLPWYKRLFFDKKYLK